MSIKFLLWKLFAKKRKICKRCRKVFYKPYCFADYGTEWSVCPGCRGDWEYV